MGKLIRDGFDFFLGGRGNEMHLTDPTGTYTIQLELGMDDTVRLLHAIRTGNNKALLPVTPAVSVHKVTRTLKSVSSQILHELFNHCNDEKIYQTLAHTVGFKTMRLGPHDCV